MDLFGLTLDTGNIIELVTIVIGLIVAWVKLNLKTKVNASEIALTNSRIDAVITDCKNCKSEMIVKVDKYQESVFTLISLIKKELSTLNATISRLEGVLTTYISQNKKQ